MPGSEKTKVIEHLFLQRHDPAANSVTPDLVTFADLAAAITASGANLRTANLANFWKDIIRSKPENYWPAAVLAAGWTGEDAAGQQDQASFRFVPLPAGQTTAFATPLAPSPAALAAPVTVQSLSMPIATKALGRSDENWVTQVAARLAVVETHFAVHSARTVAEVVFLQTGVKLRGGEVDAAYKIVDTVDKTWLVSAEVKSLNEQLWPAQVLRAAQALAATAAAQTCAGVIPFGLKLVGASTLWTVEFDPVTAASTALTVATDGIVVLAPAVQGL